MGHSPPGYLSAVKITQVVASDSCLTVSCPGASMAAVVAACLRSAFPRSCAYCGWLDPARSQALTLLSSDQLCKQTVIQSPLGAEIPPEVMPGQGAFRCSMQPPCSPSPYPAPKAPMDLLPSGLCVHREDSCGQAKFRATFYTKTYIRAKM